MKIWKLVRVGFLALMAMMVFSPMAKAQQYALYMMGTAGNLRTPDTGYAYGGTMGLYREKQGTPLVAWALDMRFTLADGGEVQGAYTDKRLDTGLFGFRLAATPHMRLKPYVEGALGYGYWRGGIGLTRQDQHTSVLQGIGGVDYRINSRMDWRVAEVTYSRMSGQIHFINPITMSTGIVLRIP